MRLKHDMERNMATVVMDRPASGVDSPVEQQIAPSGTKSEQAGLRQRIIDCDVHHNPPNVEALFPYLPRQYVEQIKDFGSMTPHLGYTNMPGGGARQDLWEGVEGEPNPAAVPEVCIEKHLDRYGIDMAILTGGGGPYSMAVHPTVDYAAAYCRAYNDWTLAEWVAKDDRLRASIHIAPADPQQAAAEIDRLGDHPGVAQVLMPAGSLHPLRQSPLPPDLRGLRAPRPAYVYAFRRRGRRFLRAADRGRLPHLLSGDAHGPPADSDGPYQQPDLRGRLRKVPQL